MSSKKNMPEPGQLWLWDCPLAGIEHALVLVLGGPCESYGSEFSMTVLCMQLTSSISSSSNKRTLTCSEVNRMYFGGTFAKHWARIA